ncbi:hypothetical protein RHSIM_Rhsim02G0062800 [Rhododendron simsii]|uniref:Uncharacterized protein n=1 Tax=Rhododendron simsii TaxID=118357 RepID=A0A834LX22_RHOSS|nr:hypothetical protein RHSIM_Rhsim02G0062800 [Rhododendron simsii]
MIPTLNAFIQLSGFPNVIIPCPDIARSLTSNNSYRKCVEAAVKVKSVGYRELNLDADVLSVVPSTILALCKVRLPEDNASHVVEFCYEVPMSGKGIMTFGNPDNCINASRVGIISEIPIYLCNLSLEDLEDCLPYYKNAPAAFHYITSDMNAGCGFSGGPIAGQQNNKLII